MSVLVLVPCFLHLPWWMCKIVYSVQQFTLEIRTANLFCYVCQIHCLTSHISKLLSGAIVALKKPIMWTFFIGWCIGSGEILRSEVCQFTRLLHPGAQSYSQLPCLAEHNAAESGVLLAMTDNGLGQLVQFGVPVARILAEPVHASFVG